MSAQSGPKVWEEMSKLDFQDGGFGGHLIFSIGLVLGILYLLGILMLIIKFQLSWIYIEEPSKISILNMFSIYMYRAHTNSWE